MELPDELRPWLKRLAASGILGESEDEVAIYLIRRGLHDLVMTEYVQKHVSAVDLLRKHKHGRRSR